MTVNNTDRLDKELLTKVDITRLAALVIGNVPELGMFASYTDFNFLCLCLCQGYLYGCPIQNTKHCLLQNVYSLRAPTGFSQAKLGVLTASSCFKLLKPPILLKKNLLGLRDCTLFVTNNVWFYEWDIHINILGLCPVVALIVYAPLGSYNNF